MNAIERAAKFVMDKGVELITPKPQPVINSMLDTDLYKNTMQMFILELFPNEIARYKFSNRGTQRFNKEFIDALNYQINVCLPQLKALPYEIDWFKKTCPYLKPWYFEYLRNYRYNPNQVKATLTADNNLDLEIVGSWGETVLWEVPLMAIISELYFQICDKNWSMEGQEKIAFEKAMKLDANGCIFTDFGTRRRRNFMTHDLVVKTMKQFGKFVGTSNVHLSMKYGFSPKGTCAHEIPMAMQALEGTRNCNYYAMHNWVRVYNGSLGTALPDTMGSEQFLENFNLRFAKLWDGIRCDSGSERWFTDLFVDHYKKLGIDPMTKTIIFSNALDCDKAIEINEYCKGKIRCAFGIGTKFTNDFVGSPALNMVIKMSHMNGIPVVKLSDDKGKAMGDKDAIRVAKWECFGTPLDNK